MRRRRTLASGPLRQRSNLFRPPRANSPQLRGRVTATRPTRLSASRPHRQTSIARKARFDGSRFCHPIRTTSMGTTMGWGAKADGESRGGERTMRTKNLVTLLGLRLRYWVLTLGVSGAILIVRLGVRTPGIFAADVGAVGAYITAIGTLYGILAAFTIFVVCGQFNDAQTAADTEANELRDLFRYTIYLRDSEALNALGRAIKDYSASVARDEWSAMGSGKAAPQTVSRFEAVFRAVHAVTFDDDRDALAWEKMIGKFEAVSDARSKRLDLAVADVP